MLKLLLKCFVVFIFSCANLNSSSVPAKTLKTDKIERLMEAVVDIIVSSKEKNVDVQSQNTLKHEVSDGTGFIVNSEEGLIVTNCHVIDSADSIKVILSDEKGKREYYANIIGKDEHSDIALLKISTDQKLTSITFEDSDKIQIGEPVIAIGNPFGLGKTVTSGIISYKSRNLSNQMTEIGSYGDLVSSYIQTDAAVNHGNSGGPLLTYDGKLVGMITIFFSDGMHNTGINFAIPSNTLKKVISQLKQFGKMRRSWLGITLIPLNHQVAEMLLENSQHKYGCDIIRVEENSPAAIAGIQNSDILLSLNDTDITEETNIEGMLNNLPIGKVIPIQILRNKVEMKLSIKVASKNDDSNPETNSAANSIPNIPSEEIEELKIRVTNLTSALRKKFGIPEEVNGVLVLANENQNLDDITRGDVITKVTGDNIQTIDDLKSMISKREKFALYIYNSQKSIKNFYVPVILEALPKISKK